LPDKRKIMDKNEVIRILGDWNFWRKDLSTGYERPLYLNRLKRFLKTSRIIVITGARRSGKSFIMRQLIKSLIKEGIEKNRRKIRPDTIYTQGSLIS
jgi:hypothetical protein